MKWQREVKRWLSLGLIIIAILTAAAGFRERCCPDTGRTVLQLGTVWASIIYTAVETVTIIPFMQYDHTMRDKKCRSEHYTLFPLSAQNSRPPSALQEGLGARLGLPSMWSAANVLTAACAIQNTNCYRLPYLTSSLHHSLHSFTMDNWYNYITRSHLEPADITLTAQTTNPQQGYYSNME